MLIWLKSNAYQYISPVAVQLLLSAIKKPFALSLIYQVSLSPRDQSLLLPLPLLTWDNFITPTCLTLSLTECLRLKQTK